MSQPAYALAEEPATRQDSPRYNPAFDPEALLNEAEVALMLGCSRKKLENDRRLRQGIPFIQFATNRVRYRRADVLAWISERRVSFPRND
jgi:hypothetical protein